MTDYKAFKGAMFSLKAPTDWYITSNSDYQAIFIAPPYEKGPGSNLTVAVNMMPRPVTLEQAVAFNRELIVERFGNVKVDEMEQATIDGNNAFYQSYEFAQPNTDKPIFQQQLIAVSGENNTRVITLTATRPTTPEGQDAAALDDAFNAMFRSLALDE
jgi:hypothetical protein